MKTLLYEHCKCCDSYTGNAGMGDGSIYLKTGYGPLCLECYHLSREYVSEQLDVAHFCAGKVQHTEREIKHYLYYVG
jgi:hypothetical protein